MLERSKNLSYRKQVEKITHVLMRFLKENDLIKIDPFDADGSIKPDLVIRKSNLTEIGNSIFIEYFPKWSRQIDRGGDAENVAILQKGLMKLREENCP